MKKFLIIFPLFLFLIALDAYLISDFVSNRQKEPVPDVQGISTEVDQNIVQVEIENEMDNRIRTSPTPIPVEIIDKRNAPRLSEEEDVLPTVTTLPSPTLTPTPSLTPTPIRITIPPVIN